MLLKSGKVTMIAKQPRTWLGVTDNTYRPDFWVCGGLREIHPSAKRDAPEWAEDVKGYEPREFKRIKKAWRIHGWLPLVVLFSVKGGWRREFIWPDRAGSMEAP